MEICRRTEDVWKYVENVESYIPRVSTVPCQGAEQINKNTLLMMFYHFEKNKKSHYQIIQTPIKIINWVMHGTNMSLGVAFTSILGTFRYHFPSPFAIDFC